MGETRKLAAILVADVVGYSRLAAADEDRTLARLRGLRSDLIDPAIAAHHGRIVKRTGDGLIAEFRSVVDAVRCAISDPVQIAVDVELQKVARRVAGTPHRLRLDPQKPRRRKVQSVNEGVDEPHRIVRADIVVHRLRQQQNSNPAR